MAPDTTRTSLAWEKGGAWKCRPRMMRGRWESELVVLDKDVVQTGGVERGLLVGLAEIPTGICEEGGVAG